MKKQNNIEIKVIKLFLIGLFILIYIINGRHLFFKTTSINVFNNITEDIEEEIPPELKGYTLELRERGNIKEQIKAADIGLKYSSEWKAKHSKGKQNNFRWFLELFDTTNSKITQVVDYDEELLKNCLDNLSCFQCKNIIEPQNPNFKYTESGYQIIDEVYGNKVHKDILYNRIVNAILKGETIIDLESINCYENPRYTSKSQEVIQTKNLLNKYIISTITYTFGNDKEVLDKSTINKWIKVDNDLQITFDEEQISKYLYGFSSSYDTVGKSRNFTTSSGKKVKVSGGDYGWSINIDEEMKELIAIIKEGKITTRQPMYKQTAVYHDDNDIGNTYVEINMTKQHLWFYKNGTIVVAGDVVTGNVSRNHSTPVGIYRLKFKQRDATLKGEGYSSNVRFWMPFNGGIGIHDASWRYEFGGNIYMTNGSHGCVNTPYYLASIIFNNIDEDTPIICYYE